MNTLLRKLLKEIYDEKQQKVVVLKYYALDWDDNVMFMPTKIYLLTEDGDEIGMGTEDFAEYRGKLDPKTGKAIKPFDFDGKTIIGLANDAFKDFKSGFSKFKEDMNNGVEGPSWRDMVESLNTGSYFAIITARGHHPDVLKNAVKTLIEQERGGISKELLTKSLRRRKEKAGLKYTNDNQEINEYLDECLFYPVSYFYPNGGVKPEIVKKEAMMLFIDSIKELIDFLNRRNMLKGNNEYRLKPVFGFSDDDLKNIEFMTSLEGINIYSTHGGTKKLVKKAD